MDYVTALTRNPIINTIINKGSVTNENYLSPTPFPFLTAAYFQPRLSSLVKFLLHGPDFCFQFPDGFIEVSQARMIFAPLTAILRREAGGVDAGLCDGRCHHAHTRDCYAVTQLQVTRQADTAGKHAVFADDTAAR